MQKKKSFHIILCIALTLGLLSGCVSSAVGRRADEQKKLSIVATIFPAYDWVREIVGDAESVELTLLMDNGVDLHSYQPTVSDMVKISTCDLFLYVGGESDDWADDALEEATNKNMKALNLLELLGDAAKEEEWVEGMEDDDHDHDHDDHDDYDDHDDDDDLDDDHDDYHDEPEYDEHVWLSLRNVRMFINAITGTLCRLDPDNASTYTANAAAYKERLTALDTQYEETINAANVHTLVFGDRFPFRYLTDDYSLHYYAAFAGCSAETEASFKTILFLAGKVDELGLSHVMTLENNDGRIARTIIENTASKTAQVLPLNSMQSVTSADIDGGATYLGIMERNLDILREALR